jgi:endonuclease/exonuclease/phosphatase (EEP) superfamily protein YafD
MPTLRRRLGWMLVGLSLALHLFTVFCFSRQPDHFAAFTILPIWLWGGLGLFFSVIAFYFLRASLSLIMTGVWAVTLLVGADEARVLANFGKSAPCPGPASYHDGNPVIRAITLNCATFQYGNPAKDLAAWHPDIVLLQDALPYQVKQIADVLYGGHGDYREHDTNGIVTRWKIQREIRNPTQRDQQVTIRLDDGHFLEVVNIHLRSAATDLRFWNRSTWTEHRVNRVLRINELTIAQQVLEQTTKFPDTPTLLGGDFNSPATDTVHRQLVRDFTDAFSSVGTGWGDTFQRRFPILRIDHLYANRHLTPVRAKTVTTRCSDHRMVIADFLMR